MKILLIISVLFFVSCGSQKINNSHENEFGVIQNVEADELEMRRDD